jgi:hypothetical protein
MKAVGIDKIRKPRRTSYTGNGTDAFMRKLQFFQNLEETSKHSKVPASWTPSRVICF